MLAHGANPDQALHRHSEPDSRGLNTQRQDTLTLNYVRAKPDNGVAFISDSAITWMAVFGQRLNAEPHGRALHMSVI